MKKIILNKEYFNVKDTLECGQVFRFKEYKKGYLVFSQDKCCYAYQDGENTVVETDDYDYFLNYFDTTTSYQKIIEDITFLKDDFISNCAALGKGIRILKQDAVETAYSFIISQNNNIKRIKKTIEYLCKELGDKKTFNGINYHSFPTSKALANASDDLLKMAGLGYRANYVKNFAKLIESGLDLSSYKSLSTENLTSELLKIKGVGKKVADCITLFGYARTDSFPVDTWIEKVYKENLSGLKKDRKEISSELQSKYKNLSGYVQQYVFYYKRSLEKN